jgi:hypothetical protein
MHGSFPPWVFALVLAVIAPFAAKTLAGYFEKRSRERSRQILARHLPSIGRTD